MRRAAERVARRVGYWLGSGYGGVLLAMAIVAICFPTGGNDDCYITFWSAQSLLTHGRLSNYDGVLFEQSSSLTHVVLIALLAKITTASVVLVGWVTGLLSGALAIMVTAKVASDASSRLASFASLLLATSLPFLY